MYFSCARLCDCCTFLRLYVPLLGRFAHFARPVDIWSDYALLPLLIYPAGSYLGAFDGGSKVARSG